MRASLLPESYHAIVPERLAGCLLATHNSPFCARAAVLFAWAARSRANMASASARWSEYCGCRWIHVLIHGPLQLVRIADVLAALFADI